MTDERDSSAEPVDGSRRTLALALLTGLGASSFLKGCTGETAAVSGDLEAADGLASLGEALQVAGVLRVADTAAELRATTGGTTSWIGAMQGTNAAGDGGGGLFYWSTAAQPDNGWSVLNSGQGNSAGWRRIHAGVSVARTLGELRATAGVLGSVATLAGVSTANDGGGGLFVWSTVPAVDDGKPGTAANSGTIVNPLVSGAINPSPAAGWRRIYSGPLNARWFGAVGNGVADDTAALQTAIDAASRARTDPAASRSHSPEVYVPPGFYKITSTLLLVDAGSGVRRQSICLRGAPGGATNDMNTKLVWHGPNASAGSASVAIKVYSRDCIVGNLDIRSATSTSLNVGIDVDGVLSGGSHVVAVTNNQFEHVKVGSDGVNDGSFNFGFRFAQIDGQNVDYTSLRHCQVRGASDSCVLIGKIDGPIGQNSKAHTFYNCFFWSSPIGIRCLWGSFQTYSCSFNDLQVAIQLHGSTDNIFIQDTDSESCGRFLDDTGWGQGAYAVQIIGARFDVSHIHPDGYYVILGHGGPLLLSGCKFYNLQQSAFKVNCSAPAPVVPPGVASTGATLVAIANEFPTMTPFDDATSQRTHIISLGNRGWVGGASLMLPVEFGSTVEFAGGRLALGSVQGISATKKAGNNLRGTVTVTGGSPVPAPSGAGFIYTASLPAPEADGNYRVWLAPSAVAAGSPLGATRVREIPDTGRTATSFSFVLEEDPGAGRTIRFDWLIVR